MAIVNVVNFIRFVYTSEEGRKRVGR
jgi:hypothetical protein